MSPNDLERQEEIMIITSLPYLANHGCQAELFDPLTAKLFNLNFHPLEAVSR